MTILEKMIHLFRNKFSYPFLWGIVVNVLFRSSSFAQPTNDTLYFLGNQNIAPVVYSEENTPAGVAVDIVHALAKHISQPVKIIAMDWKEAQKLVAEGNADALIQINQTEERKKIYDFSEPLLESHFSIFTNINEIGISGISSLSGLRVGVEPGGLPRQMLEKDSRILLTMIPNFLEGFKLLSEGYIDAVVVDYRVGSYVVAKNNFRHIKVTGEPIASSYSAFAVRKGNIKLLNDINLALRSIRDDGTYQSIIDKWAPTEVIFETQQQITERLYLATSLVLLTLLLITGVWVLTIRKQLKKIKNAEEKLREHYSTLRSIINSANALIFSVDRNYCYTSFNQGHAAVMKALYGAEIKQGNSLLEYMTVQNDRDIAKQNFDRALAGEQIVEESYSGEELRSRQYFQVSHSPIKNGDEIIGVAVLAQDMSDRKRAEVELALYREHLEMMVEERTRQLQESKFRYQRLFETMFQGVIYLDIDGKIISMNPAAEQILGITFSEILGHTSLEIENRTFKEDGSIFPGNEHPGSIALTTGHEVRDVQMKIYNPKMKEYRWIIINAMPLFHPNEKKPYQVYSLFEDITVRKKAENEIQNLNRDLQKRSSALESANKELEAFAYSVSHDLRAPLRHIDGFIEILRQKTNSTLDEESRHYMNVISESAKHMGARIDDLLSFSRMGRTEMAKIPINIAALVQEVIDTFQAETESRHIEWKTAPLPSVVGDRAMLRLVFINLLSNALKFTRTREHAVVEIGCSENDQNENVFFVHDNGVGFDMKYAAKLFGVFQRLHRVEDFEGTGIGLANVHRVISRHGGRTWAEGTLNDGATFYFSLPRQTQEISHEII